MHKPKAVNKTHCIVDAVTIWLTFKAGLELQASEQLSSVFNKLT